MTLYRYEALLWYWEQLLAVLNSFQTAALFRDLSAWYHFVLWLIQHKPQQMTGLKYM
jgi:hypothetical protein